MRSSHTSLLFDKTNYLIGITAGFININQNKRICQLTALSIVFTPINILAGMGGMSEFSMMTQDIHWPIAHSRSLLEAGFIGLIPFCFSNT
jgi:magnesium transporter